MRENTGTKARTTTGAGRCRLGRRKSRGRNQGGRRSGGPSRDPRRYSGAEADDWIGHQQCRLRVNTLPEGPVQIGLMRRSLNRGFELDENMLEVGSNRHRPALGDIDGQEIGIGHGMQHLCSWKSKWHSFQHQHRAYGGLHRRHGRGSSTRTTKNRGQSIVSPSGIGRKRPQGLGPRGRPSSSTTSRSWSRRRRGGGCAPHSGQHEGHSDGRSRRPQARRDFRPNRTSDKCNFLIQGHSGIITPDHMNEFVTKRDRAVCSCHTDGRGRHSRSRSDGESSLTVQPRSPRGRG